VGERRRDLPEEVRARGAFQERSQEENDIVGSFHGEFGLPGCGKISVPARRPDAGAKKPLRCAIVQKPAAWVGNLGIESSSSVEGQVRAVPVEGVYENGVLKPKEPLPLKEREQVQITIQHKDSPLLRAYGIVGWTGDAQTLERIALNPEFLPEDADHDRVPELGLHAPV